MTINPTLFCALSFAVACTASMSDETSSEVLRGERGAPTTLRVMSLNMYVGGDVDPIMTAPPELVPFVVAEAFATMQATDIAGRAAAMAEEIHDRHPELIGLQEVSVIRVQDPGDLVFGGTSPAQDVAYDFLQVLLAALDARGLHYRVVAKVQDTDAEVPMITQSFSFVDVRLTDHDVILARDDVATVLVAEQSYAASLPLPNGLEVKRGYVAIDATVDGVTTRFVSTHLEDGLIDVQRAQAAELIQTLASHAGPLVVVGDFNSRAPGGDSYQMMLAAGYLDTWSASQETGAGFTCCQDANLMNDQSSLSSRIDFIFARNFERTKIRTRTIGDDDAYRTADGLWPSDHAGVTATLQTF